MKSTFKLILPRRTVLMAFGEIWLSQQLFFFELHVSFRKVQTSWSYFGWTAQHVNFYWLVLRRLCIIAPAFFSLSYLEFDSHVVSHEAGHFLPWGVPQWLAGFPLALLVPWMANLHALSLPHPWAPAQRGEDLKSQLSHSLPTVV